MNKITIELNKDAIEGLEQLVFHQKIKDDSSNYSSIISKLIIADRKKLQRDSHKKLLKLARNAKNLGVGTFNRTNM